MCTAREREITAVARRQWHRTLCSPHTHTQITAVHGDSSHTHTHTHRSQLSHGDSGIERYAALALGNLAMDPSGRTCIYESGDTLQQLARLTSSHDTEVCVCVCLRVINTHVNTHKHMHTHTHTHTQARRYAAMAMGNLVLDDTCRQALLAQGWPIYCIIVRERERERESVGLRVRAQQ